MNPYKTLTSRGHTTKTEIKQIEVITCNSFSNFVILKKQGTTQE